jgi:ABC-type branched-subunit amino acid transport system substrate-binding protein
VIYHIPVIFPFSAGVIPSASADDIRTVARYAAFRIGNVTGKLPLGVTVNQTIYDDQNQAPLAVRAAIDIVLENRTIAVIGSLGSSMSLALQNIFVTFGMPQLSTSASTPVLSNKTAYPTFARIVSPANEKANVIVMLAVRFNWTKVYMISSTDEFSSRIARSINDFAIARNILIAEHVVVTAGLDEYDSQLLELASMNPRIVFMMVGTESFIQMIGSMYRVGIKGAATVYPGVGSALNTSIYTAPTHTPNSYLDGWLVVEDPGGLGPQWPSFVAEVQQLDENVWPNVYKTVTDAPRIASIVEAYDVMANAISSCLARAPQCDPENHQHLFSSLLATNTSTLSGNIVFNQHGDRPSTFEIFNFWNNSVKHVARYEAASNLTFFSPITWPDGTNISPLAILPPELTWLEWNSIAGIIFSVLATSGILICIATIILVLFYRNSAAIRPATWSMLIITLVGLTIGFVASLMWIGKPSEVVCHLRFWLVPIAFALIFSPLVAKTWRIMMIFRKPMAHGGAPRRLKYPLKELIIIVAVLVGIQVVICVLWSIIGSGEVVTVPDRDNPDDKAWVTCARSRRNNIFSFVVYGYLGLMLLVGGFFAFHARHAWKLWNESAWIARTIYNALFFSMLAITLGYTLQNFPLVVNILIIVFILEICYVTYFMIFGPKLWMFWRHPDQRKIVSKSSALVGSVARGQRPCPPQFSDRASYNHASATFLARTTTGRAGPRKSSAGSSSTSAGSSTSIHFERDKARAAGAAEGEERGRGEGGELTAPHHLKNSLYCSLDSSKDGGTEMTTRSLSSSSSPSSAYVMRSSHSLNASSSSTPYDTAASIVAGSSDEGGTELREDFRTVAPQ